MRQNWPKTIVEPGGAVDESPVRATGQCGLLLAALLTVCVGVPVGAEERVVSFNGVEVVNRDPGGLSADVPEPQLPGSRRVGPPGTPGSNPSFTEAGFQVEAFWAVNVGQADGHFIRGHFHWPDLSNGFEGQHFGGPRELHGLFIRAVDGQSFSLRQLSYRVTHNRQTTNTSIEGFTNMNVNVLVSTSFDVRKPVLAQFVRLPVGPPLGNDRSLPFFTLQVEGFEQVTQLFIASSASVDLDDLVLDLP